MTLGTKDKEFVEKYLEQKNIELVSLKLKEIFLQRRLLSGLISSEKNFVEHELGLTQQAIRMTEEYLEFIEENFKKL